MKTLALFDFDGTITHKDSLLDFVQYAIGKPAYYKGLLALSPTLLAFKLTLIRNDIAKQTFIAHFFRDWDYVHFKKIADDYSQNAIDHIVRPEMREKLQWHQQQGHDTVIVSASIETWLKPWCEKNNVDLIATQLEVIDNKMTGKFSSKNCYGAEKARRINEQYDLSIYQTIYAYGDSSGDKEMLALADITYYKGKQQKTCS
jgi:HAD superfamily hydrolase (TIGR01490 family)